MPRVYLIGLLFACFGFASAHAEQLYKGDLWADLASDNIAREIGDPITVLIFQTAEASNASQATSSRDTEFGFEFNTDVMRDSANLGIRRGQKGRGELRSSERLVAQMTVMITEVLESGLLLIEGEQTVTVNGQVSDIYIRGIVRPDDITSDNTLLSSRIQNAQISYEGSGFVMKPSKPGLLTRIFNALGL